MTDYDKRTEAQIELDCEGNLLGWIFGLVLIALAVGLVIATWIWL
jgi:hypothetical protein